MRDEYTALLNVQLKGKPYFNVVCVEPITFHVAFCENYLIRPFTQADVTEYNDQEVMFTRATFCVIRWKATNGTVQHITGCTWKNPKDRYNRLEGRKHAFADALQCLFPNAIYGSSPRKSNNKPFAIDAKDIHLANRKLFWTWFRQVVATDK